MAFPKQGCPAGSIAGNKIALGVGMTFIKNVLARISGRKVANYFEENGIRFFHHNPPRGNIGDYLCSPRHYFEFDPAISGLNIIGGGVYVDMGVRFIKKHGLDPAHTILWGVGESIRDITRARAGC